MWFTENPWPPIVIFLAVAAGLVGAWSNSGRKLPLIVAGIMVALAIGTYVVERLIVTESERVEQSILDLTHAFQQRDREKVLSFFPLREVALRAKVGAAQELVTVHDDLVVKDITVQMFGNNSQARSRFRANASVDVKEIGPLSFKPSRFELGWQKEGGEWKVVKITRLNPLKEEELGLLDAREN